MSEQKLEKSVGTLGSPSIMDQSMIKILCLFLVLSLVSSFMLMLETCHAYKRLDKNNEWTNQSREVWIESIQDLADANDRLQQEVNDLLGNYEKSAIDLSKTFISPIDEPSVGAITAASDGEFYSFRPFSLPETGPWKWNKFINWNLWSQTFRLEYPVCRDVRFFGRY